MGTLQMATLFQKSGNIVQKCSFTFCLRNLNTERGVDWIHLGMDGDQWWDFPNTVVNLRITDMVEYFLNIFATVGFRALRTMQMEMRIFQP